MCNPMLVGIGLAAGGQVMQARQNDSNQARQIRAQTDAMEGTRESQAHLRALERDRQEMLRSQSQDAIRRAFEQSTRQQFDESMEGAEQQTIEQQTAPMQSADQNVGDLTAILSKGGAPQVVSDSFEQSDAAADESAAEMARLRAGLSGFGDAFRGLGQDINKEGKTIDTLNSFRRGSSSLLPYELGQNRRNPRLPNLNNSPLPGVMSAMGGVMSTGAGAYGNDWSKMGKGMWGGG